ncbi:thermonuclease family protein [Neisseria leonii]|uniref:thermonuclease family protein n=1 Tax=Neisseria leonii TaxID=2995413 RepID=UPI0030CD51B3
MNIKIFLLGTAAAAVLAVLPAQSRETAVWLETVGRLLGSESRPGVYSATVESVHDGDTLRVRDENGRNHRIRLAYIDAPELQQAHGTAARDALRGRLLRRAVEIETFGQDQYRRDIARVRLDGEDINLAAIREGNAWHYVSIAKRGQNRRDFAAYSAAQNEARRNRSGLWQNRSPQAPWLFRKAERENSRP